MFRCAILINLLLTPLLAFSETITYYDCNRPDGTIAYRAEPCEQGTWEVKKQNVDLSIYKNMNKEWNGSSNGGTLELHPDPHLKGNYTVAGSINGHATTFMIDTGASFVTISAQDAITDGITGCSSIDKASTANGVIDACRTKTSQLSFGNFHLNNIEIQVVPNNTNPLLGMNVLSQFKIETSNSTMRISKQ